MKSLLVVLMLFVAGCVATDYGSQKTTTVAPATTIATTVQPSVSVSFVELPDSIKPNSKFVVKWKIESSQQKNITHTAVHYGYESKSGEFSVETTPHVAAYAELTQEFVSGTVPATFNSTILPQQSPIYLRAHAIIDGKNYWTPEKQIKEEAKETITTTTAGGKPLAP